MVAEVAKVNKKGGHVYLELVDSDEGRTTALMAATIWSTAYSKIEKQLGKDVENILTTGNKVLFQMRIEYHKIYGLKLNVMDIDPSYSFGEIEKKKKETIERLKKEKLFDLQKALYLPVIAKKIALIGSSGTAGYRDFFSKLTSNTVYRNFQIKEFQASVQGDKASVELIAALQDARQYNVDVIVILRGGGSKMDLNVFNHYDLNKEICLTKIPIITGIGHEYDEVVADLVCSKMCITPTAAAEFLYIQIGTFAAQLRNSYDAIHQHSKNLVGGLKDEFYHVHQYLMHNSKQFLIEYQWGLNDQAHALQKGFLNVLKNEENSLNQKLDRIGAHASNRLALEREANLVSKFDRFKLASRNYLNTRTVELDSVIGMMEVLDPVRLMKNGYTISTIDDVDLNKNTSDLIGKELKTLSSNALISSKIIHVEKIRYED